MGKNGGKTASSQMQFLTAFLDHRVTKSCKVTRTATKM